MKSLVFSYLLVVEVTYNVFLEKESALLVVIFAKASAPTHLVK